VPRSAGNWCLLAAAATSLAAIGMAAPVSASQPEKGGLDALFADAEERFQVPSTARFDSTRETLREEVDRVGRALEAEGADYAATWKTYLHWNLLERNLGPESTVNLGELDLVRRWLYSNQEGLELPLFSGLRERIDRHLDSAFTAAHADLQTAFLERVALARRQCVALADDPCDTNAIALARTLGWFDRTQQLTAEVARVRSLASLPNAQLVLADPFVRRVLDTLARDVEETVLLNNQTTVPGTGLLQRTRTLDIRGSARTTGRITLEVVPNEGAAELTLVFDGWVESESRAVTGPVTLHLETTGNVRAAKPLYFGPQGLELGETQVIPGVTSRVTGVEARSELVRRIGGRRARNPDTQALTNAQARSTTAEQTRRKFDERVAFAITEGRAEVARLRKSLGAVGEALAPIVREGAAPHFHSACTSTSGVQLNVSAGNRDQFGAATACPEERFDADVLLRVHISLVNNMVETITGGKHLKDTFFMKYAQLLHSELPLPLMVHSRATRWAIVTPKQRPFELQVLGLNRFQFRLKIESVELDGRALVGPTTATIVYELERNEFGEHQLRRDGGVRLDTALDEDARVFLHEKLDALFAPLFDGGGVLIPDGGPLGALKRLQFQGVQAEGEWMAVGWNVPASVIEEVAASRFRALGSRPEAH
jgi:hypothetical protein